MNIRLQNTLEFIPFKISIILPLLIISFLLGGCSDTPESEQSLEEKLYSTYLENNRMEKYKELKEEYGENRMILWLNKDDDAYWITNFTMWVMGHILPDLPDAAAGATIIGFLYLLMWWLFGTFVGGAILGALAFLGSMLGGIPGIPPAIMGIVYLGVMFSILANIFGSFF